MKVVIGHKLHLALPYQPLAIPSVQEIQLSRVSASGLDLGHAASERQMQNAKSPYVSCHASRICLTATLLKNPTVCQLSNILDRSSRDVS
jgi:hypothetical protein